jgi:tRNA threonylcarbamoyladenosine biosynthesis protein TsaB
MALLLSLESSSQSCSVALHEDGIEISSLITETARSAASQFAVMIDEVFKMAGRSIKEIKGVVVSSGPGSYTGLRIGVATAKGLCYALNVPLVSVGTLNLLAYQLLRNNNLLPDSILCPMLDARRMEVYCALFNSDLKFITPVEAKVIDSISYSDVLERNVVYFFGEGSNKCKTVINHQNAIFLDGIVPLASSLGSIGFDKWKSGNHEALNSFEPYYLKDFLIRKPIVTQAC